MGYVMPARNGASASRRHRWERQEQEEACSTSLGRRPTCARHSSCLCCVTTPHLSLTAQRGETRRRESRPVTPCHTLGGRADVCATPRLSGLGDLAARGDSVHSRCSRPTLSSPTTELAPSSSSGAVDATESLGFARYYSTKGKEKNREVAMPHTLGGRADVCATSRLSRLGDLAVPCDDVRSRCCRSPLSSLYTTGLAPSPSPPSSSSGVADASRAPRLCPLSHCCPGCCGWCLCKSMALPSCAVLATTAGPVAAFCVFFCFGRGMCGLH